jgi:hypothetical protein
MPVAITPPSTVDAGTVQSPHVQALAFGLKPYTATRKTIGCRNNAQIRRKKLFQILPIK